MYEQVHEHFPTTPLATVYKTLTLLKEMGEVLELEFSNAENRYDGNNPSPHLHLVCTHCRRIIDPEIDPLSHVSAKVAKTTGYQIVGQRFELYGICPQCRTILEKPSKVTRRKQGG